MKIVQQIMKPFAAEAAPKTDSPFIQDLLQTADSYTDVTAQVTTVVVYNPLNLEAIIAAAEIKKVYPRHMVIGANQLLPGEHEMDMSRATFVWIGVTVAKDRLRASGLLKARHLYYSSQDPVAKDDTGYKPTLIERVCVDMNIHISPRLLKVAYHASTFYDPTPTDVKQADKLSELVDAYSALRAALVALHGDTDASRSKMSAQTIYMEDMARAKRMINGSYRLVMSRDGSKGVRTLITHFTDHYFVLALRLINLSHTAFMNHWVSSNGTLLYTNLVKPHLDEEEKISPIMLN